MLSFTYRNQFPAVGDAGEKERNVIDIQTVKKLAVTNGEVLMDMQLTPIQFCVDTLLPQGVCVLCGAQKR